MHQSSGKEMKGTRGKRKTPENSEQIFEQGSYYRGKPISRKMTKSAEINQEEGTRHVYPFTSTRFIQVNHQLYNIVGYNRYLLI
jgi:hypothetical protein